MNKLLVFLFLTTGPLFSQNVTIPDTNFKNYLLNNVEVNTNSDSEIQVSEAIAFTGTLAFQFHFVTDLTGIEAFVNLSVLDCGDNNLTSINLSENIALLELYCYDNQLTSLDLSSNIALEALDFRDNSITNLDLSNNPNLYYVFGPFNGLQNIDVSQNTALTTLRCYSNSMTNIDVSQNPLLETLTINFNQITNLDLSQNTSLTSLSANSNQLETLNIANGNNTNVTLFKAHNNPNLECIEVDDVDYSTTNWTNIDETTSFSENCDLQITNFNNFNITVYPNPVVDYLIIENIENLNIEKIEIYNLSGKLIKTHLTSFKKINFNILKAGIYFLTIITKKERYSYKIIKNQQ